MRVRLVPRAGAAAVYEDVGKTYSHILNQGRRSVLFSGGGGLTQLERGDDGSALTSTYGFGGQFVYGISEHFSLDIGLSGLFSGEADIAEVARSERLYRLHGGLRYLVGTEGWLPYARVGGGAALVSVQDGDDSSLALGSFGQLGAGITSWSDDTFVVGAETTIEAAFSGENPGSRIMVNLYLGLAWGGYEF